KVGQCLHRHTSCKDLLAVCIYITCVFIICVTQYLSEQLKSSVEITRLTFEGLSFADWASEGDPHLFLCVGNVKREIPILWKLRRSNGAETKLMFCTSESCDPETDGIPYEANITRNGEIFRSFLLIKNVTLDLHKSQWICFIDTNSNSGSSSTYTNATYILFVFALPEEVTCYYPILVGKDDIEVQCSTGKISPEAVCEFFSKTNISDPVYVNNQTVAYANWPSITNGYNRTECNLTLSGNILGPGTHKFYVVMYPNDTRNFTVINTRRSSNYTDPIKISYPNALLHDDCKATDFIKENNIGNCTCYNNNTSFLPIHVTWNGSESVDGTLTFKALRPQNGYTMKFQCSVTSLNWTHQIIYEPKVAYPPQNFSITLHQSNIDKCDANNANISGNCLVSDMYPMSKVYVSINNSVINLTATGKGSVYSFSNVMNETGIFNITCHYNNTVYLGYESENVVIQGPPEIPKITSNSNRDIKTPSTTTLRVLKGDTIMCQSRGGYPSSKNLSLNCGNETYFETTEQNVNLTLNVTHNVICTCIVWHESRCYQNTTTVHLIISDLDSLSLEVTAPDDDFASIYIGIGVALGIVLVFLVLILSILRIRQFKGTAW
ncbi:unnamed protein product, partial [Lymnaea stagnalis]